MCGGGVATPTHFGQTHAYTGLSELPGGFRPGEPAADDVNLICHSAAITLVGRKGEGARALSGVLQSATVPTTPPTTPPTAAPSSTSPPVAAATPAPPAAPTPAPTRVPHPAVKD